uniref:ARAD1D13706p n=1 Tax=Blastobotrys adeninivorans TaxID=409370 RepID=A0A060T8S9_BLAAD
MPSLRGSDVLMAGNHGPRHFRNHSREIPQPPEPREPLAQRLRNKYLFIRDGIVDWLTEYRVFRIPILNWFIIIFYAAFLVRLSLRFKELYAKQPLLTMMVTNILLYGLADTLAQTLSSMIAFRPEPLDQPQSSLFVRYILEKGRPRRIILDEEEDDLLDLGLELGEDDFISDESSPSTSPGPQPQRNKEVFRFQRLALFSIWGFILSFFQSPWYAFLNGAMTEDNKFISVLRRVLTDQLCFSPVSLLGFFTYTTIVMENGDRAAVTEKLRTSYLPTLVLNYAIWPAAQFINFLFIPGPMQIPFSSTIGVFWNAYLSLKNASK